ncbi:protocatechuate 3,4-dioxygenase beta subunit [Nocardiopsis flavescens]|uniref:Protocatechuate 3,4-dioxygenase beta subunit n=1 Tax=Nocardiopsis flavescens TaxID=758803 RepID=A0A1M6CUI0_9ACTN|nr:protocatechuate 3,4-dioxygenase beta subunit [Nocardiopsis flavescens]
MDSTPVTASGLEPQSALSARMAAVEEARRATGADPRQPALDYPPYRSTALRHPTKDLHHADPEAVELFAPCFGERDVDPLEADLTLGGAGEPLGERTVVTGRVTDARGRPVRRQLVEVWQANAGGRYVHSGDRHPAPLDPNFTGAGRCLTDDDGYYRFQTVKPGPYPWRNHHNAWRPAHIHFSLFGTEFSQRLVTQMYFPGDQLLALDPILASVTDPRGRAMLVAAYDHGVTTHEWATGYRWDIVLGGAHGTPLEDGEGDRA